MIALINSWWPILYRHLNDWASWRHPVWPMALTLVLLVLLATRHPESPPVDEPGAVPESAAAALSRTPIDPAIHSILAAARQEAVALGKQRLTQLVTTLEHRVETAFLPRYLSFFRRKFEEIRAYNAFALDRVKSLFGADSGEDSSVPMLINHFDEDFSSLVLTPPVTRRALQTIGQEVAQHYAWLVAVGLQELQETRGIGFTAWRHYLQTQPTSTLAVPGQPALPVSIAALAVPDPLREHLGEAVGLALEQKFTQYPAITQQRDGLRLPDGRSIFAIGSNVWAYYGSYVVYWIVLITLFRTGFIPFNISGALMGWLLWETFVWSTWIGLESLDFEKTRAQLEPVILQQADLYFTQLRALFIDPSQTGPFSVLLELERIWAP